MREIQHKDHAALVDLDDTLAVSEKFKAEFFNRAMADTIQATGIACPVRHSPGYSSKSAFESWITEGGAEHPERREFYRIFSKQYTALKDNFYQHDIRKFPDSDAFVAQLANRRVALISSNPLKHLQWGLETLGWDDGVFDAIIPADDKEVRATKPSPRPLYAGAWRIDQPIGNCFYTGDSGADAEAIEKAGMEYGYIVHRGDHEISARVQAVADRGKVKIINTLDALTAVM